MSQNIEKQLKNVFTIIENATDVVLVLVVAEGCENNYVGQVEEEIRKKLINQPLVTLEVLCYAESEMKFPRMLTQVVYYFAPNSKEPLFSRVGILAITRLERDITDARQMMNGQSYEEIFYPTMISQFKSVDKMIQEEDTTQFSKEFQRSRNNAKISWENGKTLKHSSDLIVPAEVAFDRYEICKACPSLVNQTCLECGCAMEAKTQLVNAECPVGKWKIHTT